MGAAACCGCCRQQPGVNNSSCAVRVGLTGCWQAALAERSCVSTPQLVRALGAWKTVGTEQRAQWCALYDVVSQQQQQQQQEMRTVCALMYIMRGGAALQGVEHSLQTGSDRACVGVYSCKTAVELMQCC
jgi:hypothetical protein